MRSVLKKNLQATFLVISKSLRRDIKLRQLSYSFQASSGGSVVRLTLSVVLVFLAIARISSANAQIPSGLAPYQELTPNRQENAYTLGAGDQIRIDIFDVPELSGDNGQYTVLVDGSLNLPWIGQISVQGLTLREAAKALTLEYSRFINNPLITVSLLVSRPIRIGIVGEVNRPGVYTTGQEAGSGPAGELTGQTAGRVQTVTQAIQTAGGINQVADIRKIEVHRLQRDGTTEIISANLWDFLQNGDLSQDVTLRDGDTVIVPTATELNSAEAPRLAAASFSPGTINVNVVGEVVSPGAVAVQPNVSLNQAILAAGGFDNRRARTANVELIRLNPNGTVARRTIPINLSAGLNDDTNPALRNNDIVVVGRSNITRASDFLDTLLTPLTSVFGVLRLFGF